jgi:3-deoxy-D-manno-octulosonate 8-phosphate phosphatase (KDO 8-P phosphatase)
MAELSIDKTVARNIKLLLMDCDGVLTDGRLYFSARGEELKVFNVRDGQGLVNWHKAGFQSGIISGRGAEAIIRQRASELGIRYVKVSSADKCADFYSIIQESGVEPAQTAFIGDDVGDVPLLRIVGLPIAVADAVDEAKAHAALITRTPGGSGAVREIVDLLLTSQRI